MGKEKLMILEQNNVTILHPNFSALKASIDKERNQILKDFMKRNCRTFCTLFEQMMVAIGANFLVPPKFVV